jgi:addiction module HigA family antidote
MSSETKKPNDLGVFIREEVIPEGMSVKEAAERLRVGRPALSNLLNGKASLSPEMLTRLEKAFGADRQKLLDIQAQSAQSSPAQKAKTAAVRSYVPDFLTIKARQIENWAGAKS